MTFVSKKLIDGLDESRFIYMSVDKKRLSTALPKLPVPPVIISVFPAKMLITIGYIYYFKLYFVILFKFVELYLNTKTVKLHLIPSKNISRVYFALNVVKALVVAVRYDGLA